MLRCLAVLNLVLVLHISVCGGDSGPTIGRFSFPGLSLGAPVTINVEAAGFDRYTCSVALQAAANVHDVSLARTTLFSTADYDAYLLRESLPIVAFYL